MRLCGYCGGRVARHQGRTVHATSAPRIPRITPGDYVSAAHNTAGTPVGSWDLVDAGNVRAYMVLTVRSELNPTSIHRYALPRARGGSWVILFPSVAR